MRTIRTTIISTLSLCFLLFISNPAFGSSTAGFSEYIVPGNEEILHSILDEIGNGDQGYPNANMHSFITLTAWADSTSVYYDHWENGYGFDPDDPEGTADEFFNANTTPKLEKRGDSLILEGSGIPTEPRGTSLYYDGRDRIYVAGGAATVSRASWTESAGVLLAVAWEVYPVRPQLTTYILAFGENLASDPSYNLQDFERVFALIQATADDTVVTVDFDNNGTPDRLDQDRNGVYDSYDDTTVELQAGDVFRLDRNSSLDFSSLDSGATIKANKTVQVQYIVGDQGSNYEIRGLSAFPRGLWDDEYYAPVDSGNDAEGDVDIFLYNPHDKDLTVSYESLSGNGKFTIAAKSSASFQAKTGEYAPVDSSLYFKGDDVFWGVSTIDTSAHDTDSFGAGRTHDWGYSLVPAFLLEKEHFMGWSPGAYPVGASAGSDDPDHNSRSDSGVFIGQAQDNIRVFVDFDNDGTPDQTHDLGRLETIFIYDPTDGDLSETNITATGPFALAYGQNPETAPGADPAIDVGYTAIPANDFIQLALTIDKTAEPTVVAPEIGERTTFTLTVNTYDHSLDDIQITDLLPEGWQYVDGSAWVTLADRTVVSGGAADPVQGFEYLDDFALGDYSHAAAGSRTWVTDWIEQDDDGLAGSGQIQVATDTDISGAVSLAFLGDDPPDPWSVARMADLSASFGAVLSFDYRRDGLNYYNDTVDCLVCMDAEPSNPNICNDSGGWTLIASIGGDFDDASYQSFSVDLATVLDNPHSGTFAVQFSHEGNDLDPGERIYFDNVRIDCGKGLSWPESLLGDMAPNQETVIRFEAETTQAFSQGDLSKNESKVIGKRKVEGVIQTFAASDFTYVSYGALEMKKATSGIDPLNPGDTFTYSVGVSNPPVMTDNMTGIAIYDPLPDGVSYVDSSATVTVENPVPSPVIRATEYYLGTGTGEFTGTTYDLALDQELAENYFVIVRGSDGNGTGNGNRGPDENYIALTADPFGTGDLSSSGSSDVITLGRGNNVDNWVGVVTVVESLSEHETAGFTLLDVQRVAHADDAYGGTDAFSTGWSDIGQAMLVGGFNGAGCETSEGGVGNMPTCWAKIWPSGTNTVNWTRDDGGGKLSQATSTVMAVQWGSEWTVQRANVTGSNGGDGADAASEYNTASISPVDRDNTWVWGTGHTDENGLGDGAEGVLITLGDGAVQNDVESTVAASNEYGASIDFEVYALTHPNLAVDYQFKSDGNTDDATVDVSVDTADTANARMALAYNGCGGTGTAYPRPLFSARYIGDSTVRMERRRTGQPFPAWVQGIDFSAIANTVWTMETYAAHPPPNLVSASDGYFLAPGGTLTLDFDVTVDDPLETGIREIVNTASVTTEQLLVPIGDSVSNIVVVPSSETAEVGDLVWLDIDGDGIKDVSETGIANVEVALKDQYGTPLAYAVTDASGNYLFTGVSPGTDYYIEISGGLPAGFVRTGPGRTDDRSNPFGIAPAGNYRDNFGSASYINSDSSLNWFGNPWFENDAGGGEATGGEILIAGGELRINGDTGGASNAIERSFAILPGADTTTLSFDFRTSGVEADDEMVLEIRTYGGSWTELGSALGSLSGTANFDISDYQSSNTTIRFKINAGYGDPDDFFYVDDLEISYSGFAEFLNLYDDADLGYRPSPDYGAIGNRVWSDTDGDEKQDDGEPGIADVEVALWRDADGDGYFNTAVDVLVDTLETGPDGTYLFTNIAASGTEDYFVYADPGQDVLAAYAPTTDTVYDVFDIDAGDILLNYDFGFYNASTRIIRDRVWFDNDGDGDDDVGPDDSAETGIANVTVDLLDASKSVVASTRTDADGHYNFTGVLGDGADYTIRVTDTYGKLKDYYGTTAEAVQRQVAIDNLYDDIDFTDEDDSEWPDSRDPNFGYNLAGTLGDRVFNDNGQEGGTAANGVQDGGEPGIGGVTVHLYMDADGDDLFEPGGDDGDSIGSTVTDSDGTYLFSGLDDGTYFVSIDSSQAALDGFSLSSPDDSPETGHQQRETIVDGVSNLNADFGHRADNPRAISGTVWEDDNENGAIDGGEARLEDVTLELYRQNSLIAVATTDASGFYSFVGIAPGTYTVKITDENEILTGLETTWEYSEGIGGGYDDMETVDTTAGDVEGINFGYLNPKPTTVLVSSFGAFEIDGRFVVQWETASEIGTLGFYLYRQGTDGEYSRVNENPITAVVVQHGGRYRCVDPWAEPGVAQTYRLAEIEASGVQRRYGPYTVEIDSRSQAPSADEAAALLKFGYDTSYEGIDFSRKTQTGREKDSPTIVARNRTIAQLLIEDASLKIETGVGGLHRVDAAYIGDTLQVEEAYISERIQRNRIRIFNQGKLVTYLPAEDGSALYFYAQPYSSIYTDKNIYWLTVLAGMDKGDVNCDGVADETDLGICLDIMTGVAAEGVVEDYAFSGADADGDGKVGSAEAASVVREIMENQPYIVPTMEAVQGTPPSSSADGLHFRFSAHFEEEFYYKTDVDIDAEDFWIWDFYQNGWAIDYLGDHYAIQTPGVAPEYTAQITVNLQGLSNHPHEATLTLNPGAGVEIGTVQWQGLDSVSETFSVDQSYLLEGENKIGIQGAYSYDQFALDSFDIEYSRYYTAYENRLEFDSKDYELITVSGFAGSSLELALFDLAEAKRPKHLSGVAIDESSLSFEPVAQNNTYLAVDLNSAETPDAFTAEEASNLKDASNEAQYLIIAGDELLTGAQALADYRQNQAPETMSVKIAVLTDVFDEFSYGIYDPYAIRDFIDHALSKWATPPEYVALVGHGTADFKETLETKWGLPIDNPIPVLVIHTPYGIYGADNLYADTDGDGLPNVPIGRFPAKTDEQVQAMVDKIAAYEAGLSGYSNRLLMVADNPDGPENNNFPADSQQVASQVPAGFTATELFRNATGMTDTEMRNQFVSNINDDGVWIVNYIGHGGYTKMTSSDLFQSSALQGKLANEKFPIYVALTCLVGGFAYPDLDCLGEELTLMPDGGFVATWAPTGLSVNSEAVQMNEDLFHAIFEENAERLGDAVKMALERYNSRGSLPYPFMLRIYNLLGDPALALK